MTLQKKTAISFLILVSVFTVGCYVGLHRIVHPTFEALERESVAKDVDRARQAVEAELRALDVLASDYAVWDHAFEFVNGKRGSFVEENLDMEYWQNIDVHMMLFFDSHGELVWGGLADPAYAKVLSVEEELTHGLSPDHPLLDSRHGPNNVNGLLRTQSHPLMVSSHPIYPNVIEGAPAGTVVIGKYLNESRIQALRDRAYVEMTIGRATDSDRSGALPSGDHSDREDWEWTVGENGFVVTQYLADVFGMPAFYLTVRKEREMLAVGNTMIDTVSALLLIFTVLPLLVFWLYLRRSIVAPVSSLTEHMLRIRETGDLSEKIDIQRADEIGQLAGEFDLLTNEVQAAQEDLKKARDDALHLSKVKSEFLARMSHEIRTPMNGVLGMVELLNNTPLGSTQKRYAYTIHESADRLLDIINDVLDFSKIEAGKLQLEEATFDLNSFLTDVVESLRVLAQKKNLAFDCVYPEGVGLAVTGDPFRLRQILTNLLGNAIKFTESGGVTLEVSATEVDAVRKDVRFVVRDTGIGISSENKENIFDSFAQEDGSMTRRFGGTGLGLAISKELVDMMGGALAVESVPGQGSKFTFSIRMRACTESEFSASARLLQKRALERPAVAWEERFLAGKVLLAEDNPVNQEVAVGLLEAMNVDVTVVANGREAVALSGSGEFDVILMDCHMPLMDGYEATRAIRDREASEGAKPVGIIAVTANALSGDRNQCIAAGMNDYVSKPFSGEELYKLLAKYLPGTHSKGSSKPVADMSALPGPIIVSGTSAVDQSVLEQLENISRNGRGGLAKRVVEAFLGSSSDLMAQIRDAISAEDGKNVHAGAHALKSSSANVGALNLAELCRAVETAGRENDFSAVQEYWQLMRTEYAAVVAALTAWSGVVAT
ncbi:MAG: ATP-binding protein [Gammaproteobacteria bacterium]|nr:ATP-binding protein [Gammaproteobacteria bacterium]